jgi:hypothetical protein
VALVALGALLLILTPSGRAQTIPGQRTYKTPEAAVKELVAAVKAKNNDTLFDVIGPEMKGVLSTGDPNLDAQERDDFLTAAKNRIDIKQDGNNPNRRIAYFGLTRWPFPAPLVKQGDTWRFDGAEGRQEVEDRRIGNNELDAIDACYDYVDAQLDYASQDRMGDGVLQFAQRLVSTPGKKDGLYWSSADGGDLSPIGLFIAEASSPSVDTTAAALERGEKPGSYAGYRFKVLTAQGDNATGGAHNFLVDGRLLGGFGLVAYPVEYGKTGVSTFVVNQLGVVYEKDLGPDTASVAAAITTFNPDGTWKAVEDDTADGENPWNRGPLRPEFGRAA